MKKVLAEVLTHIKPTPQEEKALSELTKQIISKIKLPHTSIIPGGSGAKGTWLRGNHDIDLYIKFSRINYAGKDISKILGKELAKRFTITKLHGSRDYYQAEINGITIEFIPLFDIAHPTEATNITDISPLHTVYVKRYGKPDEIRLFKAFCKAHNVYGAESYKQGLSGYVCEILVTHYGSFEKTLKNIATWKAKTEIGNKDNIKQLNPAKKVSPLILIDPVDSFRNAAAAISDEQYHVLILAAKDFLKKPTSAAFVHHEITLELLRKNYPTHKILTYTVVPLKTKKDVAGAKLRKGIEYLTHALAQHDFIVHKTYWTWNKHATYYFVLDAKTLPYLQKHLGPPVKNTDAVRAFQSAWKKYPLKQGTHVYVEIPRRFQLPEDYLTYVIRTDKNLKNYFRSIHKQETL